MLVPGYLLPVHPLLALFDQFVFTLAHLHAGLCFTGLLTKLSQQNVLYEQFGVVHVTMLSKT